MIPQKLPPIPKRALSVPCNIKIFAEELSEDGEPVTAAEIDAMCMYSEKATTVTDSEKRIIRLEGSIAVSGDVAPDLPVISDGIVTVMGKQLKIYRVKRARNPNGTVHHTTLELM